MYEATRTPDFDSTRKAEVMIDATTRNRLRVSTDGGAGPYIRLLVSQLVDVQRVLDQHGIRYAVEEEFISLDGGPEEAVIDLHRTANVDEVQALLDTVRES
jgi:hypothetical protein